MNSPSLLPIGAFSSATQLSAKALRLYAEHNVLTPARIDAETGYRYYCPEQVHQARIVRLLRELDVPLAEIARRLANPGDMETWLKRHMEALAQRHLQQQTAYRAALILLRPDIQLESQSDSGAIFERPMAQLHVLTAFLDADSKTLLARSRAMLSRLANAAGPDRLDCEAAFIHLASPLSALEEVTLELCVPIRGAAGLPDTFSTRDWPAQQLACVDLQANDGIVSLTSASDALFDWFDRNGASITHAPLIFFQAQALQLAWPISR